MNVVWVLSSFFVLPGCGGDSSETGSQTMNNEGGSDVVVSSNLQALLSEEKVCEVLSIDELKTMFNITGEVKTLASAFRQSYTCRYTWEPVDKEAKEAALMKAMMSSDRVKVTARDRMIDYELSVTLKETTKTVSNFVPVQLSQAQLDQQIEQANQAAAKRLTAEQKELAGDAASEMMTKLLIKNNQNQTIDGVGDAAFWNIVGGGGLNVLDAGISVFISPLIADDQAGDLDNAKKIFSQLIK